MQVVWPAPDLQVDFCYAVALDQRAEVIDQAEVCRAQGQRRAACAEADRQACRSEHLGPAAAEAAGAVENDRAAVRSPGMDRLVLREQKAFIDGLARQELLEEDQLAELRKLLARQAVYDVDRWLAAFGHKR